MDDKRWCRQSKHPIASCGSVALYLMQNILANGFPKVFDSQKELTLKQKGCSARSLSILPSSFTVYLSPPSWTREISWIAHSTSSLGDGSVDEDLDWISVSLQTVGKAVPMVAAQQSKEVTGCQDSGLVSLALPWMRCATFDKLLRKSLSNGTDTIGCIYIKVLLFRGSNQQVGEN